MATYTVQVKVIGGWTTHSSHDAYRDAVDQADMVHGRIVLESGATDEAAWQWAMRQQGFTGDFAAWQSMDDEERAEYEAGAAGVGTI